MNHLIEVVFEDVSFHTIGKLFKDLSQAGKNLINYSLNADWKMENEIDWHRAESISQALSKDTTMGWSFFVNLNELNIKAFRIENCTLQVLKYDCKYDVGINFKWEEVYFSDSTDFVETLREFSRKIAHKYDIKQYFAGLEPACDEETRLFTNHIRGPLNLSKPNRLSLENENHKVSKKMLMDKVIKPFAICICNDNFEDLEQLKIYQTVPNGSDKSGYIRIIDESGKDDLYPENDFVLFKFPQTVEQKILAACK